MKRSGKGQKKNFPPSNILTFFCFLLSFLGRSRVATISTYFFSEQVGRP